MDDAQLDIARRFVACKRWRWMPGMRLVARHLRDDEALRVVGLVGAAVPHTAHFGASPARRSWVRNGGTIANRNVVPDITDPATLGCLLALVREAYSSADGETCWTCPEVDGVPFEWCCFAPVGSFHADSEAEALLLALEAAP